MPDIDLSKTYMSGGDLTDTNLARADLSGADLSGADISGANLSGANLSGADLEAATYTDTNTSKEICENHLLLPSGTSTCPTLFPDGFNPSEHNMNLLQ
ncbi:pentapeptide repeat-containing protein [Leptothoe kymatousa]|uniref:pentapeptide repeat-containing protein n=1 Tax=Leptothoe kymatousa TaxID=2651727 RepID=UPI001C019931